MAPKTPRGQTRSQVLNYVKKCINDGIPPTVRDVQNAFGFKAVQTAREHLEKLVSEGLLLKKPGVSRGYMLPFAKKPDNLISIPVLGQVQAGNPSLAVEIESETLFFENRQNGGEFFALNVRGESMRDAGILHGDTVIVKKQAVARSGEIVVAIIDDEATVKRLGFVNGNPVLYPENDLFLPIYPENERYFAVLGIVVEVRRVLY